jgi:CBS domain-containing protein
MKKNLLKYIVNPSVSISYAYKKMLKNKMRIIFICDEKFKIIGLVTDGDFRRAFW